MKKKKASTEPVVERVQPHEDAVPLVIGDGLSAVSSVLSWVRLGYRVNWIPGSRITMTHPMNAMAQGTGSSFFGGLLLSLGLVDRLPEEGSFIREFRKSNFVPADWIKKSTDEERTAIRDEYFVDGERVLTPIHEVSFGQSWCDLEDEMRILALASPLVRYLSHAVVSSVSFDESGVLVNLSDDAPIRATHLLGCDRVSALSAIEGLGKTTSLFRSRRTHSVLQLFLKHSSFQNASITSAFFAPLHREAGEVQARNLLGSFFNEGRESVWTVVLPEGEGEDNAAIAKRLRRMKQSLDKMFSASEHLPEGKTTFLDIIENEQVRFLENEIYSSGSDVREAVSLPREKRYVVFSSACGFESLGAQLDRFFSAQNALITSDTQSESGEMQLTRAQPLEEFSELEHG